MNVYGIPRLHQVWREEDPCPNSRETHLKMEIQSFMTAQPYRLFIGSGDMYAIHKHGLVSQRRC
jgi:hypothetical protein